ncbi:Cyclic-di-GMP-binding biofilm dispersal mediator protein [Streptomyces sp. PTY087I2]|nr:Cyclic-di-GMP-binding biofilm dispersal mediator protein [Streptomyces sp. PTY087I2]
MALTYVSAADRAKEVVPGIEALGRKAVAIQADSADPAAVADSVEQTAATLGGLDVLVNNAGIFPFGPVEDVTLAEIDRTLAVHVRAVFLATQATLPHMGHGGRVISIGSCWATRVPVPNVTLYAMSKSTLVGFTKGLAHDVAPKGITANIVDVANAVAFLAGPEAQWITGTTLAVDGGYTA